MKHSKEDLVELVIILFILMECENFDDVKFTLNKFKEEGLLSDSNYDKFMRTFEDIKVKKSYLQIGKPNV